MLTAKRHLRTAQAASFKEAVKVALIQRGLSVTALAKELQLARNTVSMAINQELTLPSVKKLIREHLGL
ncbi:MAG: hypothetical protein V4662_13715 [Verrucomicrobiota bacterium]